MPTSSGLTHIAMSVPTGTLFRVRLLDFYGTHLGWTEMSSLRRPDRLTVSVGPRSYINMREQAESATNFGYEHFGVLMESPAHLRQLWNDLAAQAEDVQLEPLLPNEDGEGSFRFRHLLPMAVEAQYYAGLC